MRLIIGCLVILAGTCIVAYVGPPAARTDALIVTTAVLFVVLVLGIFIALRDS